MNKRAFLLLVLALTWTTATSQIPSKVSYQGLLTNNAGQPVADGNYDLQFDLYNAALLGTLRHSETHTGVEVLRGTFNVILGSSSPLPAIFSEQLFVEITVLGGPGVGSALTFSPRTELTSAPYSLAPWTPSGANISFSGGNVGIGTSSPVDLLTVGSASNRGTIGVVGSVPPAITLRDTRSGGGHWTFYTGVDEIGDINLYDQTLGTPQYALTVKKGTNKVGLGTATPAEKLDVVGTIQSTGFKLPTGASSGYVLTSDATGVASWQPAPSSGGNINGSGTANFLSKFTGTNTIGNSAVFETGGNVGIGTTSPSSKLQVAGSVDVRYGGAPTTVTVVNTNAIGGDGGASRLAFLPQNLATQQEIWGVDGHLSFRTGGVPGTVDATERVSITSGGNVGIGTSTPNQRLGINGMVGIYPAPFVPPTTRGLFAFHDNASDAQIYAYNYPGNEGDDLTIAARSINFSTYIGGILNNRIYVGNNGNVGVGTVSPSQKLDVAGMVRMTGFNLSTAPSTGYVLTSDASGVGTWQPPTGGGSQWTTSGSNIHYNLGNVGIGTTSPADKLTVIDNANVQQSLRSTGATSAATFRVNNNADQPLDLLTFGSTYAGTRISGINNAGLNEMSSQGSNGLLIRNWSNNPLYFATNSIERMRIDGSGNVGIGTTTPAQKLDVAGTVQSTGFKMPTGAGNGYVLKSDASGSASWQPSITSANATLPSDFILGSGAGWDDVTGMTVTVTVGASGTVLCTFSGNHFNFDGTVYPGSKARVFWGITVDGGTDASETATSFESTGSPVYENASFSRVFTGLTPGSHTFQLRYLREVAVGSTLVGQGGPPASTIARLSAVAFLR